MIPDSLPLTISIDARPELRLQPGDFVSVKIIRRLAGNKWSVGIRGRVISVYSELDLEAGAALRALVSREGKGFVLRIGVKGEPPLLQTLVKYGLHPDPVNAQIVMALLQSGVAVKEKVVLHIRRLLKRLNLEPKRFARLVAMVLSKKIDLSSAGIDTLMDLLSYGDRNNGKHRYKRRKMPRQAHRLSQDVKTGICERHGGDNTLQLFNHLKGVGGNWIIIPYDYAGDHGQHLSGTIRLHYPFPGKPDRMVMSVQQEGRAAWSFVLMSGPKGSSSGSSQLSVFCNEEESIPLFQREMAGLRSKLQNLGVEIDDTILTDDDFDGFSLPCSESPYKMVDTAV